MEKIKAKAEQFATWWKKQSKVIKVISLVPFIIIISEIIRIFL